MFSGTKKNTAKNNRFRNMSENQLAFIIAINCSPRRKEPPFSPKIDGLRYWEFSFGFWKIRGIFSRSKLQKLFQTLDLKDSRIRRSGPKSHFWYTCVKINDRFEKPNIIVKILSNGFLKLTFWDFLRFLFIYLSAVLGLCIFETLGLLSAQNLTRMQFFVNSVSERDFH